MDYRNYLIKGDQSLKTAMTQLDRTARKILFVINDEGRLISSLTDGDIRRFLLKGGALSDPVEGASNPYPKFLFDTQRSQAEEFMKDKHIDAVPIVNEDLLLLDVVFHDDTVDLSQVRIRELTPADRDMILAFFAQMAGDTRAMFNRGDVNLIRVINYLDGNGEAESHYIAVVEENGVEKIVGYVFIWDTDKLVPWLGIAVHEQWKGRHLGRLLLAHLDTVAEKEGFGGLMLTTVPANIRAQSLYTRMGYEYMGGHASGEFMYIKRFDRKATEKKS